MKTVLSIAGSDSSGGAGIQADLKTMIMNGVYGMTAVTALTAQNTKGVTGILEVSSEDIRPDAVKIGMVPSAPLMETIAYCLKKYQAENIVVDPVMVATSGSVLMETEAAAALKKSLLPVADLATPNIPEAEALSGRKIKTSEDMEQAAKKISEVYGCGVLCKGGHSLNDASDYLFYQGKGRWFRGRRIDNPNTHGTGCTLSSAIASNLAKGYSMEEAVQRAKEYLSGALAAMLDLGGGSGPMDHGFPLTASNAERQKLDITIEKQ